MSNDITALMATMKAAAEKASNGEWVKESGDGWEATCSANDQANGGFIIAHFEGPDAAANREFVQAANPANVKALIEALEKAHGRIAELDLKLAKPVRLPKTNGYWTEQEKAYEEAITLAKRQIRLAGFQVIEGEA